VEARASRADARTVARLLEPQTVAVIGAGRRRGTIGHEVLRQLLGHEFAGPVYPVNREAAHVASVRAWPSILDVPDQVDLAIVAVPAAEVLDAVEQCARARVGALVVVSLGFDRERSAALVALAHRHGIRVLGPGSFGAINTDPAVRLHATFAPVEPRPGRVALSLQSGTLAAGIIRRATAQGLGFSSIVAVGDKLDVSGNDLLAWWEHDDRTDVIALSLESYGNPRRFRRLAPRIARCKPIVAVVRGLADDALLAQTGVIGVRSLDALLDAARVLAWQPVPAGGRVGVVADSSGSMAFAVTACLDAGLEVVRSVSVPADAPAPDYEAAVVAALGADDVDVALVLYAAGLDPRPTEVAAAVARGAASVPGKAVVASFPGHDLGGVLPGSQIPELGFPEAAAEALAAAVRHGIWCARPVGEPPTFDDGSVDVDAALAVVTPAPDGRLGNADAVAVLGAFGVSVVRQQVVASADSAGAAAVAIGGPVALKATGRAPWAKTELAGVALDLQGPDEVSASWARMADALGDEMTGGVVQAMVRPGVDLQVGLEVAPVVGLALGVGTGGAAPEGVARITRAVLPLTDATAAELLDRAGLASRFEAADDRAAVVDLLLRLSLLAEEVPRVDRLVLNPVIVSDGRAWVTDVELDLRSEVDDRPDDLRRL
jgi:acetyltransferase